MKSHPRLLALASAVLMGLAYHGRWLVPGLVMLVPVLVALEHQSDAPRRARLATIVTFALPAYLISLHWVYAVLAVSPLAILMYFGLAFGFTVCTTLALGLADAARRRLGLPFVVGLPTVWIALEWARAWGDTRMTADHLAHVLAPYPFVVQFADVVGPYGVGALVVLTNAALASWITRSVERRRSAAVLAACWVVVLAYDATAWSLYARELPTEADALRDSDGERIVAIAAVQPDVPLEVKWDGERADEQIDRIVRLTRRAAEEGAEVVVWPESAWPESIYHLLDYPQTYRLALPQRLARELGVAIVAGAEYARIGPGEDATVEWYNAAFGISREGRLSPDWVAKVYLVPFTEEVPYEAVLEPLLAGLEGEGRWLQGGFDPGPATGTLSLDGLRIGVLVCYEQLFPDRSRALSLAGAEVQVVMTNDAWWGRSVFQDYLADALRLRAIETRTPFVRVANNGISGFVDAAGRYRARTPLFEEAVEVERVRVGSGEPTVYTRYGDVLAWLAAAGCLTIVGALGIRRSTSCVEPSGSDVRA